MTRGIVIASEARRYPYYIALGKNRFLGFRTDPKTWIARSYDPATGKRPQKPLGDFIQMPPGEHYTAALKAAREWFARLDGGVSTKELTVGQTCKEYTAWLKSRKPDAAVDVERRFKQYVLDKPIASILLDKLKPAHVRAWRTDLAETPVRKPAKKNTHPGTDPEKPRLRSNDTLNRDMVCLRAAPNCAQMKSLSAQTGLGAKLSSQ